MESAHWEGVHSEIDILPNLQNTDVSLSHIRVDLHFSQIVGDLKNDWRLQTGRDRLPDIHAAGDHHTIDRRCDCAVVKVRLCFIQRALFNFHIGFRLVQVCYCLIEIRFG